MATKQRFALEELVRTATEVHRISDRGHDAWTALATALRDARTVIAQPEDTTDWQAEIEGALNLLGKNAIRVREGGGPENLAASLALTFAKLDLALRSSPEEPSSHKYATHGACHICGGQPGDPIHAVNGGAPHAK